MIAVTPAAERSAISVQSLASFACASSLLPEPTINVPSRSHTRSCTPRGSVAISHVRRVNGPVYARADSGGIEAMEIAGSVDAEVDSGGVRVSQTTAALIKARTDSGGAEITLARAGGYDIRAHAGSEKEVVERRHVILKSFGKSEREEE